MVVRGTVECKSQCYTNNTLDIKQLFAELWILIAENKRSKKHNTHLDFVIYYYY